MFSLSSFQVSWCWIFAAYHYCRSHRERMVQERLPASQFRKSGCQSWWRPWYFQWINGKFTRLLFVLVIFRTDVVRVLNFIDLHHVEARESCCWERRGEAVCDECVWTYFHITGSEPGNPIWETDGNSFFCYFCVWPCISYLLSLRSSYGIWSLRAIGCLQVELEVAIYIIASELQ